MNKLPSTAKLIAPLSSDENIAIFLTLLVKLFKRRFFINQFCKLLPYVLAVIGVLFFIFESKEASLLAMFFLAISGAAVYWGGRLTDTYRSINNENITLHLNRHFPHLQESAQLLLSDKKQLNVLQQLQQQKVLQVLTKVISQQQNFAESLKLKTYFMQSAFVILILLCGVVYLNFSQDSRLNVPLMSSTQPGKKTPLSITLFTSKTIIEPPQYTQQHSVESHALDLSVNEGATVTWKLAFSEPNREYQLVFADGEKVRLIQQESGDFIAKHQILSTGVYKITAINGEYTSLHTLTVKRDLAPKIRILTPKSTITEIAKNAVVVVDSEVKINDDFAVSKVEILASIAKGSGESVKFRDQIFNFDFEKQREANDIYQKQWRLTDLGMEPGDELYFSVRAWDNKSPVPQLTRSNTKIIRWLEDEQEGIQSSGLLIDFMPEYFKSQRQIIIETIELIDDKAQLSDDDFTETSELLGVAQSSLKEKYGQYLGDEFESGSLENSEIGHEVNHESSHRGEQDADHGETKITEHDHEEGRADEFEMNRFGTDRSGSREQMSRFGHNHGDADIGMMNKQDPKALMKLSIANMWQAELHLMLSQPELALPYEQQALKFLKMAKKAERIYVKRLGFEPPPVTEQRRYQGELDDILTYQKEEQVGLPQTDMRKLSALFQMLNQNNASETANETPLTPSQKTHLLLAKKTIEKLINERPSLITSLATVEKLILADRLFIADCQQCVLNLQSKIWQVLSPEIASPALKKRRFLPQNNLVQQYGTFLEQN